MMHHQCFYNGKTQELLIPMPRVPPPIRPVSPPSLFALTQVIPLTHPLSPVPNGLQQGSDINTPITFSIFHKALLQKSLSLPSVLPYFKVPDIFFYFSIYPCVRRRRQATRRLCAPKSFRCVIRVCELRRRSD